MDNSLMMRNNKEEEEEELDDIEEEEELDDIEEEEDEEEQNNWEDWKADDDEELDSCEMLLCLFCDLKYGSSDELFKHCCSSHHFDFAKIRTTLALDFYSSFKLINYIRSQVAQNRCWSCGLSCQSKQDLQSHLHEIISFHENSFPWEDDKYLNPFLEDDSLLYSFSEDDECQDEFTRSADEEELMRNLGSFEKIHIDYENNIEPHTSDFVKPLENGIKEVDDDGNNNNLGTEIPLIVNGGEQKYVVSSERKTNDMHMIISPAKAVENKIMNSNKNYFGSYSSFGIHREMISDKVRTDAYRRSIIDNPSLINGAVVLDVGCGTGILSLFAAQAGASRVIAVEASDKMAAVATQIAKDNGLLWNGSSKEDKKGVIEVVHGMVEELVESRHIQPHSVDVLVSEWMGYCLLYESMLSSVLIARDQWLKPGGAILPDTATMFVAGFGRGATSIPFWEDVYGFSMSCVGKELVEDAAQGPIVDVVNGNDIVTNTAILQTFDLATMKPEEVEFTATTELEPKLGDDPADSTTGSEPKKKKNWCYGLVLWFDTCFTNRFCKDAPTVLSTSPYTPKTHWSQTILTLREPIALAVGKADFEKCGGGVVGTDECPASRMESRISIVRAPQHRSIDISVEVAVVGMDGRRRKWPVQIFNLY